MMALRFQRVTSIVSPLLPRPDARGVTIRNTARQTCENRTITVDSRSEATYFQRNCSGSENLLLVIQSLYGILCHHGNITGIPTRGVGTNPTQSASLYSGAGSACGDYGIHGPYLTGAGPHVTGPAAPNLSAFLTPTFERSSTAQTGTSPSESAKSGRTTGSPWPYSHPDTGGRSHEVVVLKPEQCTHCRAPLSGDDPKPLKTALGELETRLGWTRERRPRIVLRLDGSRAVERDVLWYLGDGPLQCLQLVPNGANVIVADRWFPSSKMCRICRTLNDELTLKDRVFVCGGCGHTEDRDIHAAMNLHNYPGQQGK